MSAPVQLNLPLPTPPSAPRRRELWAGDYVCWVMDPRYTGVILAVDRSDPLRAVYTVEWRVGPRLGNHLQRSAMSGDMLELIDVAEPRITAPAPPPPCTCDIRDLWARGHDANCGERR